MKKTIAVLLVAIMVLSFVACGGSSVTEAELVGTWTVTEANAEGGEILVGTTLTFNSDKTYDWTLMGMSFMSGTFEMRGGFLYLDDQKEMVSINDNTMTIKDASGDMTLVKN